MSLPAAAAPRDRILAATIRLLAEGGADAVSTRAVGEAAGVQAPTIYRLFGDKRGLLDAAADRGLADYLAGKRARPVPPDPLEGFREGWDQQIELALDNPALYLLMQERWHRPAAVSGADLLRERIERIARAGRLRLPVETAVRLVHATGSGVALDLLALPAADRDPHLSEAAREAVLAAITTATEGPAEPGPTAAAIALRAHLPLDHVLRPAESALLTDWLDRIAAAGPASSSA